MTTRIIENLLEAEALAEEMRDQKYWILPITWPETIIDALKICGPGGIIQVPNVKEAMWTVLIKHWDFPYF